MNRQLRKFMATLLVLATFLSTQVRCFAQSDRTYDKFGGVLSLKSERTGWFHVEQMNGRWYYVTPEGSAFFSLGVTHADDSIRRDERNLFETKHGKSKERLSEFILGRFECAAGPGRPIRVHGKDAVDVQYGPTRPGNRFHAFDHPAARQRNAPLPNLYVSMLQRLGIETDHFASSTGTLRGLMKVD